MVGTGLRCVLIIARTVIGISRIHNMCGRDLISCDFINETMDVGGDLVYGGVQIN